MKKTILISFIGLSIIVGVYLFFTSSKDSKDTDNNWSFKTLELSEPLNEESFFISSDLASYTYGYFDEGLSIFSYSTKENMQREIYHNESAQNILFAQYIETDLYIATSSIENGKVSFTLDVVTNNGQTTTVFTDTLDKMPIITANLNTVLINTQGEDEEGKFSKILSYNIESKELTTDLVTRFNVNSENLYSGDVLMYASLNSKGYLYQVISYDNEQFDVGGKCEIYQYEDKQSNKLYDFDEINLFILGNKDILIRSQYDYDGKSTQTGFVTHNDKESIIENVRPGNDLLNGLEYMINGFVFNNAKSLYRYTPETKTVLEYQYASNQDASYSPIGYSVSKYGTSISYLEKTNNKQIIYYTVLEDTTDQTRQ